MIINIKRYFFYLISSYTVISVTYAVLNLVYPHVFVSMFRMPSYHVAYPYQYIAVISLSYAPIATFVNHLKKIISFKYVYLIILSLTIICSSFFGGILWTIHDMEAGYYPEGQRFIDNLLIGAVAGLDYGWLLILLSFPINLISIYLGFKITKYGQKNF